MLFVCIFDTTLNSKNLIIVVYKNCAKLNIRGSLPTPAGEAGTAKSSIFVLIRSINLFNYQVTVHARHVAQQIARHFMLYVRYIVMWHEAGQTGRMVTVFRSGLGST